MALSEYHDNHIGFDLINFPGLFLQCSNLFSIGFGKEFLQQDICMQDCPVSFHSFQSKVILQPFEVCTHTLHYIDS